MRRSIDRIRTTHVGSLPRPPELLALLRDKNAGRPVDRSAFEAGVTAAVSEVVARQQAAGLDAINDGEQGRVDYTVYVADRLSGLTGESTPLAQPAPEFPEWEEMARSLIPQNLRHPACDGPLAWRDFAAVERDIRQLKSAAVAAGAEDELFITAVSPGQIARFLENQYYPDDDAYLEALAAVMQREYEAIAAAGVIVQLDCPDLAFGYQYGHAGRSLDEFRRVVARHVEVLNAATAKIPPERLRMHVCWSSTTGPHHRDIELREIAAEIVKARPQAIAVAGANPRHEHEWRVWREVPLPDDKLLIPGVIDTTTNFIEHPQGVADRIERYASVVGRERVIAGGDCGFGTFADRVQSTARSSGASWPPWWREHAWPRSGSGASAEARPDQGSPQRSRPAARRGSWRGEAVPEHRFSRRLLADLPSPQREVLTLRLVNGLSVGEVAEQMQINPSLVRRIQQQGLLQIRRGLASA